MALLVLELEAVMLTKYETKSHRVKGTFLSQVPVTGSQQILWLHKYVLVTLMVTVRPRGRVEDGFLFLFYTELSVLK